MTAAEDAGLVILVPVLRRPHRVEPTLRSVAAATPGARLLFIPDPDDWDEIRELERLGASFISCGGSYATKINFGVIFTGGSARPEPWIFLGADDLHFHPGWFEACLNVSHFGSVIGTNDLGNERVLAGEHSTHTLVHRSYVEQGTIDEPGKLLHEGYPHEFVDDEFVETARARGAYVHARDAVVEHLHPLWGKAPTDPLYDAQRQRMRVGRRIYNRRRRLWAT